MPNATVTDQADADDADAAEDSAAEVNSSSDTIETDDDSSTGRPVRHRLPSSVAVHRYSLIFGLIVSLALGSLIGWLAWQDSQSDRVTATRAAFLQAGRQGALNLTTIDWQHVDADTQRILDSATGTFHDDFARRSQPFIDLIKQTRSTSVGTITVSGVESMSQDDAQVLVAMSVKMSTVQAGEENPRAWRMRLSVHKLGNDMKISNVEFVP